MPHEASGSRKLTCGSPGVVLVRTRAFARGVVCLPAIPDPTPKRPEVDSAAAVVRRTLFLVCVCERRVSVRLSCAPKGE